MWAAEAPFSRSGSWREAEDEQEALRWAALQRLPTVARARRGLLRSPAVAPPGAGGPVEGDDALCEVDVAGLSSGDRTALVDRLLADSGDAEQFFRRIRARFDAVHIEFPKIEVRYEDLTVDAYVHVGSRALPTIPNFICNMTEAFLRHLRIYRGGRMKLPILDNINGIIRPSRMTLLLGPPSSGKTTLLLALAGRLGPGLKMSGSITYNGHHLNEFVPQRTSAYVSQQDWHASEMTVRETLEFAGRCQGVGIKYDMLVELLRREKNAGIKPDEDLDVFMKALALEGRQTSLVAEYIMKILGLDICADTIVGDEMVKGISGGQKKRLTTGELLVGSARVLFMDEISTGLDSATTYQIIKYLRDSTHAMDGTTIISLLQPAPETYELFDDVILISEGQIVYQGPREYAADFFAAMGFKCPERKNVADFLQEVLSKKDQQQYWCQYDYPYQFVSVTKFAEAFKTFVIGKRLHEDLDRPYNRKHNHPAALSTSNYGVKRLEILKSNFQWQRLLMKRNSFIYVFKFIQLLLVALITMTVFFRTTMHHDSVDDGIIYLGALYFAIVMILFNGFTEVSMLVAKLPVLYKHRDLHFYPPWAFTLPSWLLSIPTSLIESGMWTLVTYYVVGYDPQFTRFLGQFLLLFFLHQTSLALFRVMASLGRNMIVANTFGSFALLVVMILGGFIITKESIPVWWIWGYWISPMMYAQNAISVNEFHGRSWSKPFADQNITLGEAVLSWNEAWSITERTVAYTNHTVLPEALEKWSLDIMQKLLPRHVEIIETIDEELMNNIVSKYGTADISLLKQKLKDMRILDNVDLPASVAKLFIKPKEKKGKLLVESLEPIAEADEKTESQEEENILSETTEKKGEPDSEEAPDAEKEDPEYELDPFAKYDPQLPRVVRMANLCVVGGHSVNGVAEIHSEIVKQDVFNSFYEMWPTKFQNKTNGVTPRRWIRFCNPELSTIISKWIGSDDWILNTDKLSGLKKFADDEDLQSEWRTAKRNNKMKVVSLIRDKTGYIVSPDAMFDVQVKRIHEYKRQLLNILGIVYRYKKMKEMSAKDRIKSFVPRVCIFGGKAFATYVQAKRIVKFITDVAATVNYDPDIGDLLKVVFVPDYNVSIAETLIPASELSQHISTAGMEASGTSNMKFAMNGCLLIGTLDGANVEIREEVGEENFFLFGAHAPEIAGLRQERAEGKFVPDPRFEEVKEYVRSGVFGTSNYDELMGSLEGNEGYGRADYFLVGKDFPSYIECQEKVDEAYRDQKLWTRMSILNTAGSPKFSSDRTIHEYAKDIWGISPVIMP